jgi:hypothetical protein
MWGKIGSTWIQPPLANQGGLVGENHVFFQKVFLIAQDDKLHTKY